MAMPAYGSPKSIPAAAFTNWSPNSTATAAISASQKSDKTNWPGQARYETYPFRRLRRHETGTGVHLPRHLHLYLQRPERLRPLSPNLPQQQRRRTIPRLHPHRPDRPTKRDDRHPRQSVVLRRIHRLGSSERGNQGNGSRIPTLPPAKPVL